MKDKIKHFAFSMIIALWSTEGAICAGITKEWCDRYVYHSNTVKESCLDLVADVLGVAVGTMIRVMMLGKWGWY